MENENRSPGFTISCENPDFQSKLHNIFDGIDESASNMVSSDSAIESAGEDDSGDEGNASCTIARISKEFVKPSKPDFLINPSRYTKYSLRGTELSDDKSNSQIAFQFLQEIDHREDPVLAVDASCDLSTAKKHVFKMPEHVAVDSKPRDETLQKVAQIDIKLCDKVELEHLEENISAAEYTNEIAAKLDDAIAKFHSVTDDHSSKEEFKLVTKKSRSNLRNKTTEED